MSNFKIISSQKDMSFFGWLKIRYTDEYNDELWEKVVGDKDTTDHIRTRGICALERNARRITKDGLFCRSRFEEGYAWCKEHGIVKVRMCSDDIEYAIAVCSGVTKQTDGSDEMRQICRYVENESRKNFVDGLMHCGMMYIFRNAQNESFLRCWFEKGCYYDECQGYIIDMSTRFNLVFDYIENPANGDRIFTFRHR